MVGSSGERRARRRVLGALIVLALAGLSLVAPLAEAAPASPQEALGAPASPPAPPGRGRIHRTERTCTENGRDRLACHAIRQTDQDPPAVVPTLPSVTPLAPTPTPAATPSAATPSATPSATTTVVPSGYGPTDLRNAYNLLNATGGGSATVAIIDAYEDPNAESDLATYRSTYGLPPCTTANGCFRKVNQTGAATPLPVADGGWAGEISLDVDALSAVCPNCRILLVEAQSSTIRDLGTAVNTAVNLGAKFVSNSYGGSENGSEPNYDSAYYNHPGVAITASSGDSGYGIEYPASGQGVTAVGGTSLLTASNARGWSETAWSGAGSGCSGSEPKPSFQTSLNTACTKRAEADVAAVADPQTGIAVYQTYGAVGWQVYGGTSAAAPIVAGIYALAGNPGSTDSPNAYPYAHAANLNDVTSGTNGTCGAPMCAAGAGYDGPTGLGSPNGTAGFTAAATPADPIAVKYAALGGSRSYLGTPVGSQYTVGSGKGQNYTGGSIFYSAATGAWAVHGAILTDYNNQGGPAGPVGFPTTDETTTPDGVGRYNHFAGTGGTASIYWTPNTGAHALLGAIRAKWAALGYERSVLGYPTTDQAATPDGVGRYNHFAGTGASSIYWTSTTGAHEVHGAIRAKWASLGYERSTLGYPTSDEYAVSGGRRNNFVHGTITWIAATGATTVP